MHTLVRQQGSGFIPIMAITSRPLGRRKKDGELATERKSILFTPSEWEEVEELLSQMASDVGQSTPLPFGTFTHDLLLGLARGEISTANIEIIQNAALEGTNQLRVQQLAAIPCGPQDELFGTDREFVFSEDVADELEARQGDFVARAVGVSMEGAGIFEGDLICLRPLKGRPPSRYDIVVAVTMDGDKADATLKRVTRTSPLELEDGDGNPAKIANPDGSEVQFPFKLMGIVGKR